MSVHRADMSLRDVTVAWVDETSDKVRVTSRTRNARRILGISKKVKRAEIRRRTEMVNFHELADARRVCVLWVPHEMRARWIKQHCKIVSLLLMSKRKFNKKVSYLNKKSLRVFEFRDSYVLYMFYHYEHYMSISHMALIVAM